MSLMSKRKQGHIDAVLWGLANARDTSAGFDHVHFEHCALPELDLSDIALSTDFLGKSLRGIGSSNALFEQSAG